MVGSAVLLALLWGGLGGAHRPVVIVHGLFDSAGDFGSLRAFINESHPGTDVTVLDLFDRGASLRPLWVQVEGFRRALEPIMANAADGVHLVGYSQGRGAVGQWGAMGQWGQWGNGGNGVMG
uniref:Lysosomal thioesterase PPT2 n=1 Tax=Amazona collaria TaxID=241587 RepID=A0A8B9G676_9PSIT